MRSMAVGVRRITQRRSGTGALAAFGAMLLLVLGAGTVLEGTPDQVAAAAAAKPAEYSTLPDSIRAGLPQGAVQRLTVTTERLLQGRLLLVDGEHPIPEGVQPPVTYSVLGYVHGRVACRDQQAQLGREALLALEEMFVDARNLGMRTLTLFAGTRSPEQQRLLLCEQTDELSRRMDIEQAAALAKTMVDPPGCAEHQLPWTADIRICRTWNGLPESGRLEDSEEGRWLKEHAWEYGFIQRYPDADPAADQHRPYCFRYVGTVHARLMHETGLDLEGYLALLREKGALTLVDRNGAPVLSAVCAEAGERHTVYEIPREAVLDDASMDNTGWTVLSFTYP